MSPKQSPSTRVVAVNRRARFDYFIDETMEAGIALVGTEVKGLRLGRANLRDSYAGNMEGELYLINAHIGHYPPANQWNHEEKRPRKLLVKKRERDRLFGLIQRERVTIVPLQLYFNDRGIAKVELGVARGKKKHDKRETEKQRDWNRQRHRLLRERG